VDGIFVTGTDTGVGKTIVAASLCAAGAARGKRVAAFKPVVTGLDEPDSEWPPDHELLASAASAGQTASDVAPFQFGPAVSPHLAVELAGEAVDPEAVVAAFRSEASRGDVIVVEGVGGLLVPLASEYLVRDFAGEIGLALVIVARPGLGTISHTLLTIEAARAVALPIAGVVMTPWPADPSPMERSNWETIERFGDVRMAGLPFTDRAGLAQAGEALPVSDWLAS
jgi:dethiobiotin synthetase